MDAVGKPTTNMNPVMSGKPEMRNFVKFLSFYQFLPNIVRTVARFTEQGWWQCDDMDVDVADAPSITSEWFSTFR